MEESEHKSGFVNIIGLPNVGKSTLMNALVGERMSIINRKPQTTRHRIIGIVNEENYQIVFSDTPGKVSDPHYKMHHAMNQQIQQAFEDADVMLVLSEPGAPPGQLEAFRSDLQAMQDIPCIFVLNKIDTISEEEVKRILGEYEDSGLFTDVIGISALHGTSVDALFKKILGYMPEGPPYYPKDQLTDRSERFFVSEIIREKILELYHQELPYSVEVVVETFREEEGRKGPFVHIRALIFAMRNSQKAILIGKQGTALKALGIAARKDIEAFLDKHVFLELHVKVRDNWRDDDRMLKHFGYKN